ncbi:putative Ig domain-containing protein [Flocculibacter collagenilyticus]|uniref:putative Ig domain-containing protein n=1 Tax=Flocculibacter collagenilyticus TaxID=2744479 RepID=UPI0018F39492|nr:putative Ig domain-containing protein [Flocculibacter collagenilyticus]
MVAIVSGDAAGLFNSSISSLGQQGAVGQAGIGQANEQVFINAMTGNLIVQGRDDKLSALGADFGVLRTYNSLGSINDNNGDDNWRLGFLSSVTDYTGSSVKRVTADGAVQTFTYNAIEGAYISTDGRGAHDKMVRDGADWVYTEGTSLASMRYAADGKLKSIVDKNGKGQHFVYANGRLAKVLTDNTNGQTTTTFNYNAAQQLESITLNSDDATTQAVYKYEYDTQGRLEHVRVDLTPDNATDQKEYVTSYTYTSNTSDQLQTLTQSDGTTLTFQYYNSGKIHKVTDGENHTTTYRYSDNSSTITVDGTEIKLGYDDEGKLLSRTATVNGQEVTTKYSYDASDNLETITDGLDNTVTFGYDAMGNQISQQDAQGNRVERIYNDNNQVIIETVFNVPDPDGDGIDVPRDPQSTRMVYDDQQRLRFIVSAQGDVTEYRYNTLGQRESQRIYVDNGYDLLSLGYDDRLTESQLTDWLATLTNFNTNGILLTEYEYNFRGQLQHQTHFESVDTNGNGKTQTATTTTFLYDAQGRLLAKTTPELQQTAYSYDGLGRVVHEYDTVKVTSAVDMSNVEQRTIISSHQYDSSQQKISVTDAEGLVTTTLYDNAGRVISTSQGNSTDTSALGHHAYYYDAHGRQVAQRHQNGAISYQLYDDAGRLQYSVDRAGAVTEYHYDKASRLVGTYQYSQLISTSAWLDSASASLEKTNDKLNALSDIETKLVNNASRDKSADRSTSIQYDAAGRKTLEIDASNYATEYRYDGTGRLTHTISFADAGVTTFNANAAKSAARVARYFYNQDGERIASIDGEGYVTEYHYDSAGQLIAERKFASALNLSNQEIITRPLVLLIPVANIQEDRTTQYRYDGRGQQIVSVTPEGKVTKTNYTSEGKVETVREYANREVHIGIGGRVQLPVESQHDSITTYTYNERGQIKTQTQQPNNKLTTYYYDAQGRLIGTKVEDTDTTISRTQLLSLDELGREVGALNGIESEGVTISAEKIAKALETNGIQHNYDASGRLISSTDREGHSTFYYYTVRGKLAATIDGAGNVQSMGYNTFGEQTSVRRYAAPINALDTLSGGDIADIADTLSNLASQQDSQITSTYTKRGLLNTVSDLAGGHTDRNYNAYGEVDSLTTTLTDDTVRLDSFTYDNRGLKRHTTIDSDGQAVKTSMEYDAFGRIIKTIDGNENARTITYQDQVGKTITYYETTHGTVNEVMEVDVFGRVINTTDALGVVTSTYYDESERQKLVLNADGGGTQYTYNVHGQLTDIVKGEVKDNALINTLTHIHYGYNENGDKVTETQGYQSDNPITTTYEYDGNQRLVSKVVDKHENGLNLRTDYMYDGAGQLVGSTDASGAVTRYIYDGKGQRIYQLAADNSLTKNHYDPAGRVVAYTQYQDAISDTLAGDKATSAYTLDMIDGWKKGTSHTSYTVYDQAGRARFDIDAEGSVLEKVYNAKGQVIESIRYAQRIDLTEEQQSALLLGGMNDKALAALRPKLDVTTDQITASIYDDNGQAVYSLQKLSNGQAQVKSSRYDAAGLLIQTEAYAHTIDYKADYDLVSIEQALNVENDEAKNRGTQLFYDKAGRLRFTVDDLGGVTEQVYDAVGRQAQTVVYATSLREHNDFTLSKAFSNETLTYGMLSGLFAQISEGTDRVTRNEYDKAGRLTSRIDAEQHVESWTYYQNGQKATYTNQNQDTWYYVYDKAGRLTREVTPAVKGYWNATEELKGSEVLGRQVTEIKYDGLGNVKSRLQGHIIVANADEKLTPEQIKSVVLLNTRESSFEYDALGRQTEIIEPSANNAATSQVEVTYNALGQAVVNHIKTTDNEGQAQNIYSYKVFNEVGKVAYDVDAAGYVTGYQYDTRGNVIALTRYAEKLDTTELDNWEAGEALSLSQVIEQFNNASGRIVSTVYNTLNQKVSVKQPSITYATITTTGQVRQSAGQPETSYTYNAFGDITKQSERISNDSHAHTYYYYDKLGQKTHEVNAEGYVSEWQYNAQGQVTDYIEYAKAVDSIDLDIAPTPEQPTSKDGKNRVWSYEYDGLGRKTKETQHALVFFIHDNTDFEKATRIKESEYTEATLETRYDKVGNVTATIANEYVEVNTEYDALGRVREVTQPSTNVVKNVEDLKQGWDNATNRTALRTQYHYDAFGNAVSILSGTAVDAKGQLLTQGDTRVIQQRFNARDLMVSSTDAEGATTTYTYNHAGKIISQSTAFEGQVSPYTYSLQEIKERKDGDDYGNGRETEVEGSAPQWLTLNKETGHLQGTPTRTGLLRLVLKVTNEHEEVVYDTDYAVNVEKGKPINIVPDGVWRFAPPTSENHHAVTNYQYDALGQQVATTHILQEGENKQTVERHQAVQYNAFGEIAFKGDPNDPLFVSSQSQPLQERYRYNNAGQLISSNAGDGVEKTYLYDLAGNLVYQYRPGKGDTLTEYDKLGRALGQYGASFLVKGIESRPVITQQFDRWGNTIRFTDAQLNTTHYEYNHADRLVKETRPLVQVMDEDGTIGLERPTFTNYYDRRGNLIGRLDANGHKALGKDSIYGNTELNFRLMEYNALGKQSKIKDEVGNITELAYNAFGEQVATKDALGYITTQKRDKRGAVIETGDIRLNDQGQIDYQHLSQFEYNDLGHKTLQRNALGHEYLYSYDTQGQMTYSRTTQGVTMSYEYDRQGNRVLESYDLLAASSHGDTHRNVWTYNYFGQLQTLNDLGGNVTTYQYVNGQVETLKRDLNRTNQAVDQTVTYSYYDNGLVKSIHDDDSGATTHFEYDINGRESVVERITTNALSAQTHEKTHSFYDSNGRVTRVIVTQGVSNKVLSAIDYTYDAMGNRRSMKVINGYTGSAELQEPNRPGLNPEFEGLLYRSALAGTAYEYEIGLAKDVFYYEGEEGETLTYEIVDYVDPVTGETHTAPNWITLDKQALNETPPRLVIRSNRVTTNEGQYQFSIRASVKDGDTDQFVLLPVLLPVLDNAKPYLQHGKTLAFNDFVLGREYNETLSNLRQLIFDPERKPLTFSVDWADSYSEAEKEELNALFSIDDSRLNHGSGELRLFTTNNAVVPESFLGKSISLTLVASDGVMHNKFNVTAAGPAFKVSLPEKLELKQREDFDINLQDYIEGNAAQAVFKIEDLSGKPEVLSLTGQPVPSILKVDSEKVIENTDRRVKVTVYQENALGELKAVSESTLTITIDAKPQLPSEAAIAKHLSNLSIKAVGKGSFTLPAFSDVNGDALIYDIQVVTENTGLTFTVGAYDASNNTYTVTYENTNQLSLNEGQIRIIAKQKHDTSMQSEALNVGFTLSNADHPPYFNKSFTWPKAYRNVTQEFSFRIPQDTFVDAEDSTSVTYQLSYFGQIEIEGEESPITGGQGGDPITLNPGNGADNGEGERQPIYIPGWTEDFGSHSWLSFSNGILSGTPKSTSETETFRLVAIDSKGNKSESYEFELKVLNNREPWGDISMDSVIDEGLENKKINLKGTMSDDEALTFENLRIYKRGPDKKVPISPTPPPIEDRAVSAVSNTPDRGAGAHKLVKTWIPQEDPAPVVGVLNADGMLSITTNYESADEYKIKVDITDGDLTVTREAEFIVEDKNAPPMLKADGVYGDIEIIDGTIVKEVTKGDSVDIDVLTLFEDLDGEDSLLELAAVSADSLWLKANLTDGTLSGDTSALVPRTYTKFVTISDGFNITTTSVNIVVNEKINNKPEGDIKMEDIDEGTDGTFDITHTMTDKDGDSLTYKNAVLEMEIEIGGIEGGGQNGEVEKGLHPEDGGDNGNTSRKIWVPVLSDNISYSLSTDGQLTIDSNYNSAGRYKLTVDIDDGKSPAITRHTEFNIQEKNAAPILRPDGFSRQGAEVRDGAIYLKVEEGSVGRLGITQFFTDPDGDDSKLKYTLSSSVPSWIEVHHADDFIRYDTKGVTQKHNFMYVRVLDEKGVKHIVRVNIEVTRPANYKPEGDIKMEDIDEGTDGTFDITHTMTDKDGDSLTYKNAVLEMEIEIGGIEGGGQNGEVEKGLHPEDGGDNGNTSRKIWVPVLSDNISYSLSTDGQLTIDSNYNSAGRYKLTVDIDDGKSPAITRHTEFNIQEKNAAPILRPDGFSRQGAEVRGGAIYLKVEEGSVGRLGITQFFTDPDGDDSKLKYTLSSSVPSWIEVHHADDFIRYDTKGVTQKHNFMYVRVLDEKGVKHIVRVNIEVTRPANYKPEGDIKMEDIDEGTDDTFDITHTMTDKDGDSLTYKNAVLEMEIEIGGIEGGGQNGEVEKGLHPEDGGDNGNTSRKIWVPVLSDNISYSLSTDGQLTIDSNYNSAGRYKLTVDIDDGKSPAITRHTEFNIQEKNAAPILRPDGFSRQGAEVRDGAIYLKVEEGSVGRLGITQFFTDPDGDDSKLKYTLSSSVPSWIEVHHADDFIRYDTKGVTQKHNFMYVRVLDEKGVKHIVRVNIEVTRPANYKPEGDIKMPDINEGLSNYKVDITHTMTDKDGDDIIFSDAEVQKYRIVGFETVDGKANNRVEPEVGPPIYDWVETNIPVSISSSGMLTISTGYSHAGDYRLKVSVNDGSGVLHKYDHFKVYNRTKPVPVNEPPKSKGNYGSKVVKVGSSPSFGSMKSMFSDDKGVINLTMSGSATSFVTYNKASDTITVKPQSAHAGRSYTLTMIASDGVNSKTANASMTITVPALPAPPPPVNEPPKSKGNYGSKVVKVGSSPSFGNMKSMFSDDKGVINLTMSGSATSFVTFNKASDTITVSPKSKHAGKSYTLVMTASDGVNSKTANASMTITVPALPKPPKPPVKNDPPRTKGDYGSRTVKVGASQSVGSMKSMFSDDKGVINLTMSGSAKSFVIYNAASDTITIKPKSTHAGKSYKLTMTASDGVNPERPTASMIITVPALNRAPYIKKSAPSVITVPYSTAGSINLTEYFDDYDSADRGKLTFVKTDGNAPIHIDNNTGRARYINTLEMGKSLYATFKAKDDDGEYSQSLTFYFNFKKDPNYGGGGGDFPRDRRFKSAMMFSEAPAMSMMASAPVVTETVIQGSTSTDNYTYQLGDGHVVINDEDGTDTLTFGPGITEDNITVVADEAGLHFNMPDGGRLTFTNWVNDKYVALESVKFDDGSHWNRRELGRNLKVTGTEQSDNWSYNNIYNELGHEGGLGDDVIGGGLFNDRYYYNLGDGNDIIRDAGGIDTLYLGEGILPDNVSLTADAEHLYIQLPDGAVITFENWFDGNRITLEGLQFGDGTYWNHRAIGRQLQRVGTDENDNWHYGDAKTELGHRGGKGDDVITGGMFDDRYYYELGDGNDIINDTNGYDTIHFGKGITPDSLRVYAKSGMAGDMYVELPNGHVITIQDWFVDGNSEIRIENFAFADGTTWSRHDIGQHFVIEGTDGDDELNVREGGRVVNSYLGHRGKLGNDTIQGGHYADRYYYAKWDGNDTILDHGTGNAIYFEDIQADELAYYQDGNDAVLFIRTTNNTMRVKDWFADNKHRMDFLYFADGSRVRGADLASSFTALPDNFAPSARPLADMVTATDKIMSYPVAGHFDDANGDALTLSAQVLVGSDETGWTGAPLPDGLSFNAETGTFQGQVTTPGTYMIAVSADDGQAVTMQRFTLTVNEANVAPVYQGESQVTVTAGEFISVPVTFTDKNGDTLTYQHSTLPAWLHHDADNQTLSGMVPLDATGTHNITLTATDPAGLVANATVQLTIAAAKARTIASVPLAHQQMHYGSVQHIEIASHFTQPDGIQRERLSYDVSLQQADGSYQPLSSKDWLQWQDGQLYSAPPQAAVGVHYVRITATDSSGEQQQGEFRLTVTGPQAKDAGVIETVKAEPISIDVRQYFSGLNANAKYGVRVSLATEEATPAPSPSPAEINLAAVPMTMMASPAPMTMMSSPSVSTSTADDAPEVVIPESLKHWLTFNTETGILSGKPPEDFLDRLRVTFLAETEENTVLESHGEIMVDERATETTYWFSYDAANRVVIDGGNRESDGTIGISQHGQYFEYDAVGRANFIINNKGLTAQQLSYTAQGYLDTVRQTYSTHPDATHGRNTTVDLFADIAGRTNQAWSGINWANSIRHEYDQAGQKLLTVNHFTPGETRTVSSPAPKNPKGDSTFKDNESFDVEFTLTGEESSRKVFEYNADGKLDTVTQYGWTGDALIEELKSQILPRHESQQYSHYKVYANLSGKLSTAGAKLNSSTYEYDKGARLTKMESQNHLLGYTHGYSYGYEKRESYLENRVSGYSHNKDYQAATTKSFYDASGNRYAIEESNRVDGSKISARYFDVSADGKLIKKVSGTQNKTHVGAVPTAPEETIPGDDEGGNKDFPHDWKPPQGPNLPKEPETVAHTIGFSEHKSVHNDGNGAEKRSTTSHYLHAGGQYRGEFKRNGEVTVKSAHFEGVSVSTPSSTQRHQINQGETLKSIAVSYFGNPDYWYVIADANGLTNDADATLTAGQTIIIPSQENTANRFDTLTAYSVAEHIGDTTPNLPYAPVPPEAACNALATIIVVIVVIIVTVYTAGAASSAAGGAAGGAGAGSSAGFGATMQAGATALAGGSAGAAATGAIVGSLAGQFVGNVLGVRDGFSLKEAFVSGVTAWATAGVGGAIGAANEGAHLMKAITAASGSVANAAANKLVGNPSGFSWANVAAAAGTAAIGSAMGLGADKAMVGTSKGIAVDTLAGIARSGISHGIQKVLGGKGKFDFVNVAADAFGNAVANSVIAKAINSHRAESTTKGVSEQTRRQVEQSQRSGQPISSELAEQYIREVTASKNTSSAINLTVEQEGQQLFVTDGNNRATVNLGQITNYQDLVSARTGLADTFGDAWTGSAVGRDLNLSFMKAQRKVMENTLNTPIHESAAYQTGMARGYNSATFLARDRIIQQQHFAQTSSQLNAVNMQSFEKYGGRAEGSYLDIAIGASKSLVDNTLHGFQFVGNALIYGAAQAFTFGDAASYNQMAKYNPFGDNYHSIFGAPTTTNEGLGYTLGNIGSFAAGVRALPELVKSSVTLTSSGLNGVKSLLSSKQVGVPTSHSTNPLAPVLDFDGYGNEIFYRSMSPSDYRHMRLTGEIPATGETFISPLQAYSAGYDGNLIRLTVKPGTMEELFRIGSTGNHGTAKLLPELPRTPKGWSVDYAQFKLEAKNKPYINNGLGVLNTGLGKGEALNIFNSNLIRFDPLN